MTSAELPDLRRAGIIALDTETRDDRLRADMGPAGPSAPVICVVSAWPTAPMVRSADSISTQGVEAVFEAVLVHHGGERADLFQAFAGRHIDAGLNAQPAPVVKPVLRNKAHIGRDVVAFRHPDSQNFDPEQIYRWVLHLARFAG
jgi:hypothetical protein